MDTSGSSVKDILRPRRQIPPDSVLLNIPKTKKTAAEKQRDYRARIKNDPVIYKMHRELETDRVKQYRKTCSEEQKARNREQGKERTRRYRERKKATGEPMKVSAKKLTRSEKKGQATKWREEKRKQREKMNPQQKRRQNEKRRAKYAAKQTATGFIPLSNENRTSTSPHDTPDVGNLPGPDMIIIGSGPGFKTGDARRKAASRVMRIMPKCPEKFAQCMEHIIRKTTPRRRSALSSRCILSPTKRKKLDFLEATSVKTVFLDIKKRRSLRDIQLRRMIYLAVCVKKKLEKRSVNKHLGLSWNFLSKGQDQIMPDSRKKRKDAIPEATVESVIQFYNRGDIAREMPTPRMVPKKTMVPNKVLECCIHTVFLQYKQENPTVEISFSSFSKLRPKNILVTSNTKLMQCLCEYCINVDFKLKALNAKCRLEKLDSLVIAHKYELSYVTLCPREGDKVYHRRACIHRECEECGIDNIRSHFQPLLEKCKDEDIKWKCWLSETYMRSKKDGTPDQEARHMVMKVKTGTIANLVDDLCTELEPFSKHLLNAKWQSTQFELLKKQPPKDWVLLCMDYAENYNCHFQDEAQSAHWSYNQATIHPVVAYYRCQECNTPMHESVMIVSNDTKHDYHAVQHFVRITNEHLQDQGITIARQIHFSDGSPCQYKSKVNFADASHGQVDFGFPVEKHFFGSRHGKGPCDGEIGVLKKSAMGAVRSRQVIISDALDLFNYGKGKLTLPKVDADRHSHTKRTFLYVKKGDIPRERKDRTEVKCVPKTRSIHCVRGMQPHVVTSKERSCFCEVCAATQSDDQQECPNASLTGQWVTASLLTRKTIRRDYDHDEENSRATSPVRALTSDGHVEEDGNSEDGLTTCVEPAAAGRILLTNGYF